VLAADVTGVTPHRPDEAPAEASVDRAAPLAPVPDARVLDVGMALYGDLTFDSRVLREARSLAEAGHRVTLFCLSGSAPPGSPFTVVAHVPDRSGVLPDWSASIHRTGAASGWRRLVGRARWALDYLRNLRAWGRWAVETAGPVDVWHAHDLPGLMAIGPRVAPSQRLVYDSHEIFLETGSALSLPGPARRLLQRYERRLAQRADVLVTVNEGYGDVLATRLRPRRVVVVRNCPPRYEPPPRSLSPLRRATGLADDTPLLLYHGVLGTNRGVDHMAEALLEPGLTHMHAAFLGFGDRERLEGWAASERFGGRLHVLDPVPPDELLAWVAGADVDVIALQHTTLHHYLCTPNKLWESLAAGTPVVVSDFPIMRSVVLDGAEGPVGAVCDPASPASIAAAVRALLDGPPHERQALRERCLSAAHRRWNWETESSRLLEAYRDLAPVGT
jgi:glycosyltransferase involved in cell wall biosynthesis